MKNNKYSNLFINDKTKTNMKTAVLYARTATCLQSSDINQSLQNQLEHLKAHCKTNKIKIIGVFSECASGKSFDRFEFKHMLDTFNSLENKPNELLITKWTRLSRNASKNIEMIKCLDELGIRVRAVDEPIDFKDYDDELKMSILLVINNK